MADDDRLGGGRISVSEDTLRRLLAEFKLELLGVLETYARAESVAMLAERVERLERAEVRLTELASANRILIESIDKRLTLLMERAVRLERSETRLVELVPANRVLIEALDKRLQRQEQGELSAAQRAMVGLMIQQSGDRSLSRLSEKAPIIMGVITIVAIVVSILLNTHIVGP